MKNDDLFMPKAAIFDIDGLMLDTEGPAIHLWPVAGRNFGWDIKEETVLRTLGINDDDTCEIFKQELGRDFPYEKILNEFYRLYYEMFEKGIAHKEGLIPLLDHFSSLKIPLAVATSSPVSGACIKLEKAGILDRFTALACGDEIDNGKPAPDIFLLAAKKLGVAPSGCVGFEDSAAGLMGLHLAGIRSVFVKDILMPPEEVLATVWKRCGNLAEAIELFG